MDGVVPMIIWGPSLCSLQAGVGSGLPQIPQCPAQRSINRELRTSPSTLQFGRIE